jgi:glyoxylase-like metal-dependent hydrolase (beta-lactamase superfamily II)
MQRTRAEHLVERRAELRQLDELCERTSGGAGGVVTVLGEPGIGKSALLGAAAALGARHGLRTLSARAAEIEQGYAFGLVRQLLEPILLDGGGELLVGQAARAAHVFAPPAGPPRADGDLATLQVQGLGETPQTVRSSAAPHPLTPRPNPDAAPPPGRVNRARALVPYTRGLHEVGQRVWAWTLPDGGYGWSNAGLVAGDGASLLVDTLFDLALTREMLEAMRPTTDQAPITHALITHSNGDHTHGNQLLDPSVRIIAAEGTAEEIAHGMPPEMLAMTQTGNLGPVATPYARERFGHFDFSGIKVRNADVTFDRELSVDVGGRRVDLLNLGPAHTAADSVVHVPDAGVLFGGDLLFIGCTPIVWAGPIANWIAACDAMIALDAPTVVPGHGPITDPDGIRGVRGYLAHVSEQAEAAYRKGLSWSQAADGIDLGEYATWLDAERVVVNVYQRYRELDPETPQLEVLALLVMQADWLAKRSA